MALAKSCCKPTNGSEAGFSLIETMLATALLTTALLSMAQLMVLAIGHNIHSQRTTFAATLAQEKMEQLRGLTWGFDELGLPVSDFTSNIAVDPALPATGVGLQPSPGSVLAANTDGYVDYLDRFGSSMGGGTQVPPNTVYVRRWSVEPLPTNPNNTLILQVLVFSIGDRPDGGGGNVLDRVRDEARLVSVKTRKSR